MNETTTLKHLPVAVGTSHSIEAYMATAYQAPMLTESEELQLARRFREQDDLEAARQLIVSHLRLVIAITRGYLGYGLAHADLIQEGNIGLMKAVKRFDPERGVRLVAFATHWIKAEVHEYIVRNWRMVKIATTKSQRKLFFNLRSLKQKLGPLTEHNVALIADQLSVKPEEVREMDVRLTGGDISLEPQESDNEDATEKFAPIAWLAAQGNHEPVALIEQGEHEHLHGVALQEALAQLDNRSRAIVQRRWLADAGEEAATLHELAAELGISAERVRQIEVKAFKKMRELLGEQAHALVAQNV